jgi:hypothetical protein
VVAALRGILEEGRRRRAWSKPKIGDRGINAGHASLRLVGISSLPTYEAGDNVLSTSLLGNPNSTLVQDILTGYPCYDVAQVCATRSICTAYDQK